MTASSRKAVRIEGVRKIRVWHRKEEESDLTGSDHWTTLLAFLAALLGFAPVVADYGNTRQAIGHGGGRVEEDKIRLPFRKEESRAVTKERRVVRTFRTSI